MKMHNDFPSEHMVFGEFGGVQAITPRGKATIDICNLNREELQKNRKKEWESTAFITVLQLIKGSEDG